LIQTIFDPNHGALLLLCLPNRVVYMFPSFACFYFVYTCYIQWTDKLIFSHECKSEQTRSPHVIQHEW
jgi:hypothetical protein